MYRQVKISSENSASISLHSNRSNRAKITKTRLKNSYNDDSDDSDNESSRGDLSKLTAADISMFPYSSSFASDLEVQLIELSQTNRRSRKGRSIESIRRYPHLRNLITSPSFGNIVIFFH